MPETRTRRQVTEDSKSRIRLVSKRPFADANEQSEETDEPWLEVYHDSAESRLIRIVTDEGHPPREVTKWVVGTAEGISTIQAEDDGSVPATVDGVALLGLGPSESLLSEADPTPDEPSEASDERPEPRVRSIIKRFWRTGSRT